MANGRKLESILVVSLIGIAAVSAAAGIASSAGSSGNSGGGATTRPSEPAQPTPAQSNVVINNVRLSLETVRALEARYSVRITGGDYWYDPCTGAWGVTGGPTCGFVLPGLNLGGPLRADASRGDTGVFVNGRELHRIDVAILQQYTPVYRGRFWVDARGNCGIEGDPRPLGNLYALIQARTSRAYCDRNAGGGIGGDGKGSFYFIDRNSSYCNF